MFFRITQFISFFLSLTHTYIHVLCVSIKYTYSYTHICYKHNIFCFSITMFSLSQSYS